MPAVSIFYFTLSIFQLWSRIGEIYLLLTLIWNYCHFPLRGNLKPTFNLMIFSRVRFKINLWRFFITAVFGDEKIRFACSLIYCQLKLYRRDIERSHWGKAEDLVLNGPQAVQLIVKVVREYFLDMFQEMWLGHLSPNDFDMKIWNNYKIQFR